VKIQEAVVIFASWTGGRAVCLFVWGGGRTVQFKFIYFWAFCSIRPSLDPKK